MASFLPVFRCNDSRLPEVRAPSRSALKLRRRTGGRHDADQADDNKPDDTAPDDTACKAHDAPCQPYAVMQVVIRRPASSS
jgi:hypothetical protein